MFEKYINSLKERQVAFFKELYKFNTGPAMCLVKKNGSLIGLWPGPENDESTIDMRFIEDSFKNGTLRLPYSELFLKNDEYVFQIQHEKPIIGTHQEITEKLTQLLEKGSLSVFQKSCINQYIKGV